MAAMKWKDKSVAPQELNCIKWEHFKWLKKIELIDTAQAEQSTPPHDLAGAKIPNGNFNGADLRRIDLSAAILTNADFKDTDLSGADLSEADLSLADLSRIVSNYDDQCPDNPSNVLLGNNNISSILRCTKFNDADLTGVQITAEDITNAQFKRACLNHVRIFHNPAANLARTNFREASLCHIDFTDTDNLHDDQLVQTDLTSAALPKTVDFSGKIDAAVRSAGYARKLFTPLILTCMAVLGAGFAKGPNEDLTIKALGEITIPYALSMTIGSIALVIMYRYFLFYMAQLWRLLAVMPAKFPNGLPITQYPDPWFLINFASPYFRHLVDETGWFKPHTAAFLTYSMFPLVFVLIWSFASDRCEPTWGDLFWFLCVTLSTYFGITEHRRATAGFIGDNFRPRKQSVDIDYFANLGWYLITCGIVFSVAVLPLTIQ